MPFLLILAVLGIALGSVWYLTKPVATSHVPANQPAPAIPVLTGGSCDDGVFEAVEAAGCGAGPFEVATGFVKYQTLPSATPRTAIMIRNGSIRFILTRRIVTPRLQGWPPVSGRYHVRRSSRASLRTRVPDGASAREHCVRGCRFPRCCRGNHLDWQPG